VVAISESPKRASLRFRSLRTFSTFNMAPVAPPALKKLSVPRTSVINLEFASISLLRGTAPHIRGRTSLYAEQNRARMAELNVEIDKLQHEINEKQAQGKPTQSLGKRLEELEREKHDLVERIEALWSA
jgi:hypothetical protein